jgi:hypothetical protein
MVYMLKGKVSWLRLVAIIWTASSDAARQACGNAAARCQWRNAQAVTGPMMAATNQINQLINLVKGNGVSHRRCQWAGLGPGLKPVVKNPRRAVSAGASQ